MINSLYIHIPFCRRRCTYCDFYSTVYDGALAARYIGALVRQIDGLSGRFDTIYIGGGTPTVLERGLLERLVASLAARRSAGSEFTVEANPESLDEAGLKILAGNGVNRLSIGVQSLDDRKLKKLGRIHDAHRSIEAVRLAAGNGFANISADLIFGVWGEGPADWEEELEEASRLPVSHISAYSLTYEKGTPLFGALENGSVAPLDDETAASMYEIAIDRLSLRGFKQYEVSSFAREGFRCRHNLRYWDNDPYIGLGASAVSYIDGVRTKNIADIAEYIVRSEERRPLAESGEELSAVRRAKETAALKVRTKDGIDFAWFRERTGFDFLKLEGKAVAGLVENGLVKYVKELDAPVGIRLKRKGFLFCDTVSSALL